jgi:NAD-dependent deacetylase
VIETGNIELLAKFLANSQRSVAFTGSGISAESGIPTYRGEGGTWTQYDPEKYASIDYFRIDPGYFWKFFREVRLGTVTQASPNAAHLVLAALEQRGTLSSVITQNIDGLHQRAGSNRVLELHGNTTRFYCVRCRMQYRLDQISLLLQSQNVPKCEACAGVLRPDVVLFGELLPDGIMEEASVEAEECDLMLSIGSSLLVYPAAEIPYRAKMAGNILVMINLDPTPLDRLADLVIHAPAAATLQKAMKIAGIPVQ